MNKGNNDLDRRDFLKLGLLTTASVLSSNNSLKAAEKPSDKSPLKQYVAKKFDHLLGGTLKDISDNQLKAHFTLYQNYINKINETEQKMHSFNIQKGDPAQYRGLHLTQTFALGGAVLHELYFANLGSTNKEPKGTLKKFIDRDFGSIANFVGHLKLSGKVMQGWAIAAFNYRTGKLNVYGLDQHNQMVPNLVYPVLALDVYEHAYMIDYAIDKGKYLDAFVANLNWKPVEERLESALAIPFGESVTA